MPFANLPQHLGTVGNHIVQHLFLGCSSRGLKVKGFKFAFFLKSAFICIGVSSVKGCRVFCCPFENIKL